MSDTLKTLNKNERITNVKCLCGSTSFDEWVELHLLIQRLSDHVGFRVTVVTHGVAGEKEWTYDPVFNMTFGWGN